MEFSDLNIKEVPGKVRYATICPQCNESRQKHKNATCLTVNNEQGNRWFRCNHCNWSGNLDIMDKYSQVVEKSRMPKIMPETYSKEVREYLERRGLDMKIALREKVYEFSMAGKPILAFPFYVGHTLVNVKYFNLRWKSGDDGPRFWQMKKEHGTKSIFLGMQSLKFEEGKKKEVIICEGEWDWLTWKTCGYNNVLSVPMGAPSEKAKDFEHEFDYANDKYVLSVFEEVDSIIFSSDNDAPGHLLRDQLALIFGKARCKYVNYPIGYKDANDVFKGIKKGEVNLPALGKAGIDELYKNLSSFPIAGIIRPFDVKDELEVYAKQGFTKGLGRNIPEKDRLYTYKGRRLQVVTGLPGAGKSTYVRDDIVQLVIANPDLNLKWGMFTPENRPVSREYVKISQLVSGQSFREGWSNSMSKAVRDKTLLFIQKHFFIISPDRRNFDPFNGKIKSDKVNTMASLCEYLVYLKKTENIFGYVIDAWNKIEHEQPKNITETSYISSQLDHLIDFNDYYDLHGIIVAHPTKVEKIGINYRIPCLYDIKGSSAWKEKADIGVIVHRNMNKRKPSDQIPDGADDDDKYFVDPDAPTIIRTEKIRFEEEGVCDRIKMRMNYSKGCRFEMYEEKKEAAHIPPSSPGVNKLNPAEVVDEISNPFGEVPVDDDLPF